MYLRNSVYMYRTGHDFYLIRKRKSFVTSCKSILFYLILIRKKNTGLFNSIPTLMHNTLIYSVFLFNSNSEKQIV